VTVMGVVVMKVSIHEFTLTAEVVLL
jgi:hypothetical protein